MFNGNENQGTASEDLPALWRAMGFAGARAAGVRRLQKSSLENTTRKERSQMIPPQDKAELDEYAKKLAEEPFLDRMARLNDIPTSSVICPVCETAYGPLDEPAEHERVSKHLTQTEHRLKAQIKLRVAVEEALRWLEEKAPGRAYEALREGVKPL